ncbi:MAG: prepilin-type N-terminal cleavage/methylation domain-containing protein [Clostridiales Family XIII bacterium]|nr:prepilin-type N-terminal cleavage/methylation domain-containing protein [Clostridiales Family XIII bacterium]
MSFLCPRYAGAKRRYAGRAGFTLVEVIVVIVIIAILAAIGVPALTGYIDKAQDRQYIAMARDYYIAMRTCIDDAYANGQFSSTASQAFLNNGGTTSIKDAKSWNINDLYTNTTGDSGSLITRQAVAALIGKEAVIDSTKPNSWYIQMLGSETSTVLNSDGFWFNFWPEGYVAGKPIIVVTRNVSHVDVKNQSYSAFAKLSFEYDVDAGYEVYQLLDIQDPDAGS